MRSFRFWLLKGVLIHPSATGNSMGALSPTTISRTWLPAWAIEWDPAWNSRWDQHGFQHGHWHGYEDGEAQSHVASDRLVLGRSGRQPRTGAYEDAVHLLIWKFPDSRRLWGDPHDHEHMLYPQFLWPTHSWKTVAGHLRKLTGWRQKDAWRAVDRRGPSLVEYMMRGPQPCFRYKLAWERDPV